MKSKMKFNGEKRVEYVGTHGYNNTDMYRQIYLGDLKDFIFGHDNRSINPKFITHNGTFHPDEIFSIALLFLVKHEYYCFKTGKKRPQFNSGEILSSVVRVTNLMTYIDKFIIDEDKKNLDYILNTNLVLDIAGGHYDHHEKDLQVPVEEKLVKFISTKMEFMNRGESSNFVSDYEKYIMDKKPLYATFGLLWKDLSKYFEIVENYDDNLQFSVFARVYRDLIFKMDQIDNYGPTYGYESEISKTISFMNNLCTADTNIVILENEYGISDSFVQAIMWAYTILQVHIIKAQSDVEAMLAIQKLGIKQTPVSNCKKLNAENILTSQIDYIVIPKAEEGEEEIRISPIIALEYHPDDVSGGEIISLILNLNPTKRDGSVTVTMTDSNYGLELNEEFLKYPPEGMRFIHPSKFMMTFDTEENAQKFVNSLVAYIHRNENGELKETAATYDLIKKIEK